MLVTNPLTDEELVVREVINGTTDTVRLSLLRALKSLSNPVVQTDAAEQADVTRQAASSHFAILRDRGFVNSYDGEIELTGGGIVFLRVLDDCLEVMSLGKLSDLTRSNHAVSILQELEKRSYRLSELQTAVDGSPSRSTLKRNLDNFKKHGWCSETAGSFQIESDGTQALSAYSELVLAVEQLIEKSTWFLRLPPEDATLPVQELADADLVTSNSGRPGSVLWAALRLYDRKTSYFRALSSIYHPVLFFGHELMLDFGFDPEAEVILDLPTYLDAAENPYTSHIVNDSYRECYQPLVLNHAHTLGIGIYDDRKVAIGAYNEYGRGNHTVMIVSTNTRLVQWGIELYESYRQKADRAPDIDV
jgi:predicted transcriptional regulator